MLLQASVIQPPEGIFSTEKKREYLLKDRLWKHQATMALIDIWQKTASWRLLQHVSTIAWFIT